jgi:hypothetical protein
MVGSDPSRARPMHTNADLVLCWVVGRLNKTFS